MSKFFKRFAYPLAFACAAVAAAAAIGSTQAMPDSTNQGRIPLDSQPV
jgi:hypothetical protein